MSEQLPETGEGPNGEQLSPLPDTPADIPEYDQGPMTLLLDAQLPGKSPTADILWPGEQEGGAAVTINIRVGKGVSVTSEADDPIMKLDPGHPELEPQQELRDPRTGLLWFPPEPTKELPEGSTTVAIKNGLTVGMPDEESMDRLRHKPLFPRLQRQVPDIGSGMNVNSGPTWRPGPVAVTSETSPLDALPEQVSGKWRER